MLAGARLSHARFTNPTPNCKGSSDKFFAKQCEELLALDFKSYSKKLVEKDYSDHRVKAVIALDPGFARSFDPASLGKIKNDTTVYAAERLASPQDEIFSREFNKYFPVRFIHGSYHMSFVTPCQPHWPANDVELKLLCAGNDLKFAIQEKLGERIFALVQAAPGVSSPAE
jgi:predicted dienelactone hydrolase